MYVNHVGCAVRRFARGATAEMEDVKGLVCQRFEFTEENYENSHSFGGRTGGRAGVGGPSRIW